ncbi:MAG TPA: NAD(P)-binding domain-containing protein [Gammaproteobacteria bacterium]|nr:NAD(P)-binding domain-containing protein [Gammaproteobacteria bacterium]
MRGRIVATALAALVAAPVGADTIAVIGTGNVAGALGPEFAAQGHTIVYGSRSPGDKDVQELVARTGHGATVKSQKDAVVGASIVVLAVPGTVAEQVAKDLGDLSGKIIIDPTNRVNRGSGDGWADYDKPANAASNAELIQTVASNAKVVKAFNTLNFRQMVDPETAGGPITIAIAGNDPAAKDKVAGLIKGMGLEVVDFGPLRFAHVLEEMLVTWANAGSHGQRFNYYMRPAPPQPAPPR